MVTWTSGTSARTLKARSQTEDGADQGNHCASLRTGIEPWTVMQDASSIPPATSRRLILIDLV